MPLFRRTSTQIQKKSVSEKAVLDAISVVLANAKDWEGGRKERAQKE